MRIAVVLTFTAIGASLPAQQPTALGCDARCRVALSQLTPGAPVDLWANNARVRGEFTAVGSDASARPTILIRRSRDATDSLARVIVADELQSLSVGVSNAPRYALVGAAVGAAGAASIAFMDMFVRTMQSLSDPSLSPYTGKRAATVTAIGALTGAIGGAIIGSRTLRWEQRFARPQ